MAFRFNWPDFDTQFYNEAKSQLEAALNKGNKPKNIVDHISVTELNMGTIAPDLEILEIGELSTDKFRGIFKLTYCGDAYIVIQTKVQANPMHAKESDLPRHTRPSVLAADQPLIVPMLLKISDLKLRGIVVLVVSKTKGITLVFKNDPLESILVSSTFDSVTSVRNFLQREIEHQLRNLFQEDLPVMIHNLSLRHIQLEQEKLNSSSRQQHFMDSNRTVFSDPGQHHQPQQLPMDTFSMPDLSLDEHYPLSPTYSNSSSYYPHNIPVTAANLSTLNELYSSRFSALKKSTATSSYEATSFLEENTASSSIHSIVAAEMYADSDDAPWYMTEGPELPTYDDNSTTPLTIGGEEEGSVITVDPNDNMVAAKLARLTTIHHTISPFAHTIHHSTFRSLPHTVKIADTTKLKNNKKKPKRRIIRLKSNQ